MNTMNAKENIKKNCSYINYGTKWYVVHVIFMGNLLLNWKISI